MSETEPELYVLDEIWQSDTSFDGSICCPGCTNSICGIGWDGEITSFEAQCSNCDSLLFAFSTVAVSNEYYRENGWPSADEIEEYVVEYWQSILDSGREVQMPTDYEQEGVIVDGEYEIYPNVEPVMESVDVTDAYISQIKRCVEQFRWDWDVPEEHNGGADE